MEGQKPSSGRSGKRVLRPPFHRLRPPLSVRIAAGPDGVKDAPLVRRKRSVAAQPLLDPDRPACDPVRQRRAKPVKGFQGEAR
jgi:hypothetical protein